MTTTAGRALPAWFDQAKLGIFVHWTAAAVPAYAPVGPSPFDQAAAHGWAHAMAHSPYVEWYQNSLAIQGSPVQRHHAATYGDAPYDEFVTRFGELQAGWQPEVWAELFAAAGARYVVLVTKHHDGFLLWPSATPNPHRADWHARRDVVGELAGAVRARGMRFGVYYSGGLDWTFGGLPITDFASMIAAIPQGQDYLAYADAHWLELIDRDRPDVLWNDIGYPAAADLDALFGSYYDVVPDGVVNDRFDFLGARAGTTHTDFVTPEYSTHHDPDGPKWESTRGIGTSFGYNAEETDADYLSADALVRLMAEVAAGGGNLLLNVGPAGDGTVPWAQASRLLVLGWWLRTNGPAIFATALSSRSLTSEDGLDVVCTEDAGAWYAIVLGRPSSSVLRLQGVTPAAGDSVSLLGHDRFLAWEPVDGGFVVHLAVRPPEAPALALRIVGPGQQPDLET